MSRRALVSGRLYRFGPLAGALVALGSCHSDQVSMTDVPPNGSGMTLASAALALGCERTDLTRPDG
jgi:hypothetical protein